MLILMIVILLSITFYIYKFTFGANRKSKFRDDVFPELPGYEQYAEGFTKCVHEMQKVQYKKLTIIARDGTPLCGKYYEAKKGAPVVIMFHGYRGGAYRDGIGIFRFCQEEGYNLILVDQRAHHESGGKTITFGIKERYDCLDWVNRVIDHFGKETKIIIMGLSMGAATVLMATELDLPDNVKGVIGDCGYSVPADIIGVSIRKMKLPVKPVLFLSKAAARLFGGFNLDGASAKEALKKCKIPVLLIHGTEDSIVPFYMGQENFEACAAVKEMLVVPGAEHGMSYILNPEEYTRRVKGFLKKYFS